MKYLYIIIILCLICIHEPIYSQGNLAQSGANFLQIGAEPRGTALGGAVTALSAGAASLYWNPAGAIHTHNFDILLSHTDWYMDTKLMFGAIVKNFNSFGNVGLSVASFYMDAMEITTVYESEGTGEFYDAGDLVVGLSYARSLTDRFTFGATLKWIHEYIWNEKANQVAFDVGSQYQTDFYNLRLGIVIRNFAGKMKFSGDHIDKHIQDEIEANISNNPRVERLTPEFRLPQIFRIGIAFDPLTHESGTLTLVADADVPADNSERLIFGAEYNFLNRFFLRSAYQINYDDDDFSLGAGIDLNVINMNARFDYSYSAYQILDDVHRFAIGFEIP
ncbi:PorV/PorQ family protein [candidate division KSB1 bacterium]|nr:PorV/PorQ family protein [candidate division KSB1 bacterium]